MGRISNRERYEQDPEVTTSDYLIGTDSTTLKTKTFSIQSILALVTDSGAVDTFATLSGRTITFPSGQTIDVPEASSVPTAVQIPITTISGLAATNVQAALAEIFGDIPTNNNQLTNGANFITEADVPDYTLAIGTGPNAGQIVILRDGVVVSGVSLDPFVSSVSFNSGTNILTLGRDRGADLTVDLSDLDNATPTASQVTISAIGGISATNVQAALAEILGDIPTTTSQLTNNGADGVNPFITANDLPAATASGQGVEVTGGNVNLGGGNAITSEREITITGGPNEEESLTITGTSTENSVTSSVFVDPSIIVSRVRDNSVPILSSISVNNDDAALNYRNGDTTNSISQSNTDTTISSGSVATPANTSTILLNPTNIRVNSPGIGTPVVGQALTFSNVDGTLGQTAISGGGSVTGSQGISVTSGDVQLGGAGSPINSTRTIDITSAGLNSGILRFNASNSGNNNAGITNVTPENLAVNYSNAPASTTGNLTVTPNSATIGNNNSGLGNSVSLGAANTTISSTQGGNTTEIIASPTVLRVNSPSIGTPVVGQPLVFTNADGTVGQGTITTVNSVSSSFTNSFTGQAIMQRYDRVATLTLIFNRSSQPNIGVDNAIFTLPAEMRPQRTFQAVGFVAATTPIGNPPATTTNSDQARVVIAQTTGVITLFQMDTVSTNYTVEVSYIVP